MKLLSFDPKRWLCLFFIAGALLLSAPGAMAQPGKIDSLKTALVAAPSDTDKVNILNALGWELLIASQYDSAIACARQALRIERTLPGFREDRGSKRQSFSYNVIGNGFLRKGDFSPALEHHFTALRIREQINDRSAQAKSLGNIGLVYLKLGELAKAADYYTRALAIVQSLGDKAGLAFNSCNIGIVYDEQKNYDKALEYFFRSLQAARELNMEVLIPTVLLEIANTYSHLGNASTGMQKRSEYYSRSLEFFSQAIVLSEKLGARNLVASAKCNMGNLFLEMQQYDMAERYLKEALSISDSIRDMDGMKALQMNLSNLYEKTGNHRLAYEHYKKHIVIRDSIDNEENTKKQTQTEMQYQFDRKEAQTKAEQEKKDAVTRIVIWSISGGLGLVLLLALFIFRSYRQKQKANSIITAQKTEVERQKQLVEEKQKEMLDSIHYARRIQNAILPSAYYIQRNLEKLIRK